MTTWKSNFKEVIKTWAVPPGIWKLLTHIAAQSRQRNSDQPVREHQILLERSKALANRHVGERCFILGAGSSIAKQDLKRLVGENVLSVSNTFVHPDFSIIKPKYHVLPPIIQGHGQLYPRQNFVNWLKAMEYQTFDAEMFFHIGDKELIDTNELFTNRCIHWNEYVDWDGSSDFPLDLARVPSIGSVSEYAITIALYLGFEKIYLLGFDHDWFNGPMIYFFNHKTQHAMAPDEKVISHVDSEFQMRRHADIFKKYKYLYQKKKNIYNANANAESYVDTFPRVDYGSLFTNESKINAM